MNIYRIFYKHYKKNPSKKILVIDNKNFNFSEINKRIEIIAYYLKNKKIQKCNVGIFLENSLDYYVLFIIASLLNITLIPLSPLMSGEQIKKQCNLANLKYLISSKKFEKFLTSCMGKKVKLLFSEEIKQNNTFKFKQENKIIKNNKYILSLTSGSTATPKIMIFSELTKIRRAKHAINLYKLNQEDVLFLTTPFYHSIGQRMIFLSILLGSKLIILKKFSENNWIKNVKKHKITFTISVSEQIHRIIEHLRKRDTRISSLKKWVSCCSPLNLDVKKNIKSFYKNNFYDTYGLSEVGTLTNFEINKNLKKINSVGQITKGNYIKIKKEKESSSFGKIYCKSKQGFVGYYRKKKYNFSYIDTGDNGYIDKDGYLFLAGRSKDIIIYNGINIFPKDIENVLKKYQDLKKIVVFGNKDIKHGETISVLIEPKKSFNIFEFKKYCLKNLPLLHLPKNFYLGKIPYTILGKINKREIESTYARKS